MNDANTAALAKHEDEIAKAELLEEMFVQEVIDTGILDQYGDLLPIFHKIAAKYEIDMSFSKFIDENL